MANPFEGFGRLFSRGGIAGGRGSFSTMACDCTASNVGTAGIGVFDSKVGLNLGFRTLNALSARISIALDAPNKKIDIDVPANAFETFGAVAAHVGASDPHPQYLSQTEADALYASLSHTHVLANITDAGALAGLNTISNAQVAGAAGIVESKLSLNFPTHTSANDPSSGEKAALAGTSGTPGSGNKYVTDADSRNTNARTPTSHASTHQHGGADEVATATAAANAIPKAGAGATLAIGWIPLGSSSSTVCVGNDARLSDARTPTAHKTSHQSGGSDELSVAGLLGVLADFQIANKIRETSGPTTLSVTGIVDGEFLKRVGSNITSAPASGGSGEANTASNVGTAGVGLFKQKVSVDLQFKKINAGSAKITITDDTGNDEVDVDVVTGTSANSVCVGNDSRLSDARTPTAHAASHQHGGSDEVATATAAANSIPKSGSGGTLAIGWIPLGSTSSTVCVGNDSRLSDARTPTAHASTHQDGGADELSVTGLSGLLADAQKVGVRKNSAGSTFTRKRLNFIEGSGVTLTVADDGTDDEVDVTVAASGTSITAGGGLTLTGSTLDVGAGTGIQVNADTIEVLYGTSSTTACVGNDSRLSDSRAPTGSAGGDLGSTYPNPSVLQASSSFKFTGILSPAQITANQNNYNPTGLSTASVLYINSDAQRTITGLAGGADGRIIIIHNTGSQNILFSGEDGASTAANRFGWSDTTGLGQLNYVPLVLQYNSTLSRWIKLAGGSATAGTIARNALANGAAQSVIGNPTSSTAAVQDIAAGTNSVLGRNGSGDLAFQVVTASMASTGTGSTNLCIGNDSRLSDARTPVGTALTSANIWVGNGSNVAAAVAITGDVTITNGGVTAIGSAKVTNAMLANMANATFKGRTTAGSGAPEDLTVAQLTALVQGTSSTTLCVGNDSRLSDARTPTGSAGGDLGSTYPNPTVLQASTSFALTGDISPTQITSNQNDYNPTSLSTSSVLRLTSDTTRTITGLAGGADGRIIVIHNVNSSAGNSNIVLSDESTSSTAANRFSLLDNITLIPDDSISLIYDSTSSRWRVLSTNRVAFGTSATTACVGNDSRLSNARTPVGTALTSTNIWVGDGSNLAAAVAMSGDATLSNAGVLTVGANAIGVSKLAQINSQRILGRATATTGNVESLTATAPLAFSTGPASLTTSMSTGKLIGRTTASSGVMEEIAVDSTMSLSSLSLGVASASLTGRLKSITTLTAASGTYTVPAGVTALEVFIWGAGGGGGGAAQTTSQSAAGGGGGSGAFCYKYITSPSATYAYDIKAGGAGASAGNNNGSGASTSTFGSSFLSVPGGGGGTGSAASASAQIKGGGAGASVATGGDINAGGTPGAFGQTISASAGISGSGAPCGYIGGGGVAKTAEGGGVAGVGFGSGGSGGICLGTTARVGGAGADGLCLIKEYS